MNSIDAASSAIVDDLLDPNVRSLVLSALIQDSSGALLREVVIRDVTLNRGQLFPRTYKVDQELHGSPLSGLGNLGQDPLTMMAINQGTEIIKEVLPKDVAAILTNPVDLIKDFFKDSGPKTADTRRDAVSKGAWEWVDQYNGYVGDGRDGPLQPFPNKMWEQYRGTTVGAYGFVRTDLVGYDVFDKFMKDANAASSAAGISFPGAPASRDVGTQAKQWLQTNASKIATYKQALAQGWKPGQPFPTATSSGGLFTSGLMSALSQPVVAISAVGLALTHGPKIASWFTGKKSRR